LNRVWDLYRIQGDSGEGRVVGRREQCDKAADSIEAGSLSNG